MDKAISRAFQQKIQKFEKADYPRLSHYPIIPDIFPRCGPGIIRENREIKGVAFEIANFERFPLKLFNGKILENPEI